MSLSGPSNDPLRAATLEVIRDHLAHRDVPCARCGYNLRGITDACCPECQRPVELVVAGGEYGRPLAAALRVAFFWPIALSGFWLLHWFVLYITTIRGSFDLYAYWERLLYTGGWFLLAVPVSIVAVLLMRCDLRRGFLSDSAFAASWTRNARWFLIVWFGVAALLWTVPLIR